MVIQTELGLLRRTHYSVQLHEASGKSATVMGWISAVRGHGNISFVTIRDNKGSIQVVAKAGACPDDVREKCRGKQSPWFISHVCGVDALTSIATLGSHCSMQVLKGAKDEGFKTVLVCERKRQSLYSRFNFIDEMIMVDSFTEVAEKSCTKQA